MAKYELTKKDLLHHLQEQLYFLDSSLSSFAQYNTVKKYENRVIGKALETELTTEIESKRIATILRVLLHDTENSTSLLRMLGIKDNIQFLDTSSPKDGSLHSMTGMMGVRITNSDQFLGLVAKVNTGNSLIAVPLFKQHLPEWYGGYNKSAFHQWWEQEVLNNKGYNHTRSDLILKVANKDGGAHVDGTLPTNYQVTKESSLTLNILGVETKLERNIVYASIAQIGWEFLNSIDSIPELKR